MTRDDATLRAVFDAAAPMAVLTAAPPFVVVACNPGFRRLPCVGGPEPIEGQSIADMMAPDEPGFLAAVRRAAELPGPATLRHSWSTASGTPQHCVLTLSRLALPGRTLHILCQVQDVTAAERERRAHDEERGRHAAILYLAANRSLDVDLVATDAANAASIVCDGPAAIYLGETPGTLRRAATRRVDDALIGLFPEQIAANASRIVEEALAGGPGGTLALPRPLVADAWLGRRAIALGAAAWMGITPVRGHERILGVIVTVWHRPIPARDRGTLDLIAGQSGVALDRACLYEEVETQRARLALVLQQMPDGVWVVDAQGQLVLCNAAARALLGVDAGGSLDALDRRVRPQDPGEPATLGLRVALAGGTVLGAINAFERGEPGQTGWLLVSAAPVLGRHGETVGAVAVASDVSERRRAESILALLADVGEALGASLDVDVSLARVARLCAGRLADWCAIDLVEPDSRVRRVAEAPSDAQATTSRPRPVPGVLASVLESGSPLVMSEIAEAEIPRVAGEGPGWAQLGDGAPRSYLAVPITASQRILGVVQLATGPSGRLLGAPDVRVAQEIAGRCAAAIENARLFWAVREADRRKDEFIAMLSHELRTPLTSILGWAQLLHRDPDGDHRKHGLEVIDRNARMQLTLVNDLLDVTAIRQGRLSLELQPVDLRDVLSAAVDVVQEAAAVKGIRTESQIPDAPLAIMGDPTRLQQLFGNLLSNAVKFTPSGGAVAVTVGMEPDVAVVSVRDSGRGIAPEFLPHVFDMFRQDDRGTPRGGLGIGLALAQRIAEGHGGRIEATSDGPGCGAQFVVRIPSTLPVAAGTPARMRKPS